MTRQIDLSLVEPEAHAIFFVVNSFDGLTFEKIKLVFGRILTPDGQELQRMDITRTGAYTGALLFKLYRFDDSHWDAFAVADPAPGSTVQEVLPRVADVVKEDFPEGFKCTPTRLQHGLQRVELQPRGSLCYAFAGLHLQSMQLLDVLPVRKFTLSQQDEGQEPVRARNC